MIKEVTLDTLAQMMQDGFGGMQKQINELGEIMTRGFDQVHEKFEQVDSKIENLQTDISEVKNDILEMRGDISGLKDDVKILDLKVDLMGRHLKHVATKSDLDMVESRVTLLEAKA